MSAGKKVEIRTKPTTGVPQNVDSWVGERVMPKEPTITKRLTIDVPVDLHSRIKSECALKGVKMVDEINRMLEREFK